MKITEKAEKAVATLTRIMSNIGGPMADKTRILGVWCGVRFQVSETKVAIRIASAYRTVATKAIQVVADVVLIHLQVQRPLKMQQKSSLRQLSRYFARRMRPKRTNFAVDQETNTPK